LNGKNGHFWSIETDTRDPPVERRWATSPN